MPTVLVPRCETVKLGGIGVVGESLYEYASWVWRLVFQKLLAGFITLNCMHETSWSTSSLQRLREQEICVQARLQVGSKI